MQSLKGAIMLIFMDTLYFMSLNKYDKKTHKTCFFFDANRKVGGHILLFKFIPITPGGHFTGHVSEPFSISRFQVKLEIFSSSVVNKRESLSFLYFSR